MTPACASFLGFLVIFNLFEFDQFILIYFFSNLTPAQLKNSELLLKGVNWPLRALLLLGCYYFQYQDHRLAARTRTAALAVAGPVRFTGGLTAYFLLAMRFPGLDAQKPPAQLLEPVSLAPDLLEAAWLGRLLAESRRRPDPGHRRAGMALAWLFFGHILIQVAIFLLGVTGLASGCFSPPSC